MELLKFNREAQKIECTPEGVADAVSQLGAPAQEAKNALANCNTNIQNQTAGMHVGNAEYRGILGRRLKENQTELAGLLGLNSVKTALEKKEFAGAMNRVWNEATTNAAAEKARDLKHQQERVAAAKAGIAQQTAENADATKISKDFQYIKIR